MPSLLSALEEAAENEQLMVSQGLSEAFEGKVVIQGDQAVDFEHIHRVSYTCSMAGFGDISLATHFDEDVPWRGTVTEEPLSDSERTR